ncbi:expressed unknown protein [Seminavis robusta]|uniref:Transmembrane protein n=1 Tax=Seminavis robusta TaxID=568900 RepID=A0A9N8DUF5_9STRA|nr:expressed unknown protein [Seminavis robusta]|eukprot:Sro256_g100710.1 n/a (592) ;mRNA; r:60219-62116
MAGGKDDSSQWEFNPRWKGYLYILITSLVNFASISNLEVNDNPQFDGMYQLSLVFGIATFALTVIILAMDRFQYCFDKENADKLNYEKALDGKLEGYTLLAFTLWWIVGVAHITQVEGVGYVANNIYFSSWLTLFSCIYTLDKWSAAKDILSIRELTGISATLRTWYVLFLSSLVTMGTCCDLHVKLATTHRSSAAYGIALGLGSSMVSIFFILVHYRFIDYEFLQVGGWIELSASFFMILLWIVGVAILTSEGGIAATIGGSGCTTRAQYKYDVNWENECHIVYIPHGAQEEESSEDGEEEKERTQKPAEELQSTMPPIPNETLQPSNSPSQFPTETMTLSPTGDDENNTTEAPWIQNDTSSPTNAPTVSPTETSLPPLNDTINILEDDDDFLVDFINATMDSSQGSSLAPDFLIDAEEEDEDLLESTVDILGDESNQTNTTTNNASTVLPVVDDNNQQRSLQLLQQQANNTTKNNISLTFAASGTIASKPPRATDSPTPQPSIFRERMSCADVLDQQIPGSNLYLACWICFFASFNITLRWKAAQAMQFAQAQHRKSSERARRRMEEKEANEEDDVDVDDGDPVGDDGL